jgi:glycerol kinase
VDVLRAMEKDAKMRLKELRVDGGACGNNLLMQFQADVLGVPLVRPRVTETTALGAAYLAGLAVGFWKNRAELAAQQQTDRRFVPTIKKAGRDRLLTDWARALKRAKGWAKS